MIATRLEGGLGNQLFQYAAARALALRVGSEVLLDAGALGQVRSKVTPRAPELHRWRVRAQTAPPATQRALDRARRLRVLPAAWTGWRVYRERSLGFNSAFAGLKDGTYLVGYWQSPRYFQDCAATIARELQPAQPLSEATAALAHRIGAMPNSVALHVRRGDYVHLQSAARMHGALPLEYYRTAIARLRAQVAGALHVYVFSDDPAWCAAHLPLARDERTVVDHNAGDRAWEDLVLMSHCAHHVIANSSFSWWGAWMADQRHGAHRQVFAPARWFSGLAHDVSDRFPSSWQVLP